MKNCISGSQIPKDFFYFRSKSDTYKAYLAKGWLKIIEQGGQFWWLKNFWIFQIAKFERTDFEPSRELIEGQGFRHGLVIWIPGRTLEPSPFWRRLWIPGSHFVNTGISILSRDYYKMWNSRSQRARRKFLSFSDLHLVPVDQSEFVSCFTKVSVRHAFKKEYIKFYSSMCMHGGNSIRSYVVYDALWKPLAGLAVHDFWNTSVHLVAFTSPSAKPYQAGTGLIDRWHADSFELGLKYIHYDHLRDPHMTRDQQGYTDFKLNFIESRIQYPYCFFRIW